MTSMIPYTRNNDWMRRWGWPFGDLFDTQLPTLATVSEGGAFAMDVEDTDDAYVITAELPGVEREQIDVELNEGRLSIAVEKTETEEKKNKNWLHKETTEWSATRGVYLKDAAVEGLTAKFENGVLTVNVPKQIEKPNVTKVVIG